MTATAAAAPPRMLNPYAKAAQNAANMGRQSQQRISNQHKRKYKLCSSNNNKRKKGDQLTLLGGVAFEAKRDCGVCKARFLATFIEGCRAPNRAHHPLCIKNTKTRGKGELSELQKVTLEDNKRYKELVRPITDAEKGSSRNLPGDLGEAFFAPRITKMSATTTTTVNAHGNINNDLTSSYFCAAVTKLVEDEGFAKKHKDKRAPLAIMAFADEVADKVIRQKRTSEFFHQSTVEVPDCEEACDNPHYHSIVGQKLMLVDWERSHGLQIPCPDATCQGHLSNDRTNYSKNKTLFPIFDLNGAPTWCIIMTMVCTNCRRQFDANDGEVLVNLPDYAANTYPVDTTYAFPNFASHLSRNTTDVFASLILTYGNGEMCSKLLHNCINRSYLCRLKSYYSKAKEKKELNANATIKECVPKDGCCVKAYPPLGDTIRDMFDEASSSKTNPWRISDYERHTREMQSVRCEGIFCQDHTFEPIKNYRKRLGATAAWTCGTSTGEVAAVALVPSTKTQDFAHAATQLTRRPDFKQTFMCSDTWPNKEAFWLQMGVQGRLGLFHFEQRIIRTLKKKHVDCSQAITDLLSSLYVYHAPDYEKLLKALKEGTLSPTGKKCSSEEISELKASKLFRERYSKYLRKVIHQPETTQQNLDDWFCKYKVTSSDPVNKPAGGRLDPMRMITLFTEDAKLAVDACKEKAKHLSDPLPLEQMYDKMLPNPNSTHQLTEFLSKRGESKLEACHDRLAHFANCGMRNRLADNLNLAGTARFNIAMRHKRSLRLLTTENPQSEKPLLDRKVMPASWEKVVPYLNHSELWHINNMAKSSGCAYPFPNAETLPQDNGERFFSQYMTTLQEIGKQRGDGGECLCKLCKCPADETSGRPTTTCMQQQKQAPGNRNETIARHVNQPSATPKATSPMPRHNGPNAVAHRVGAPAHAVTAQTQQQCNHPMLAPQPTLLPMWCFPPMLTAATASCCWKYNEWLTRHRRVGRPPHHPLCKNR